MKPDVIVIGGGFYGCCIALILRSVVDRVTVIEAQDDLFTRASYVNQARIHTGFHYPRSFVTAKRSMLLYQRFIDDFRSAVVDNFTMLYAVARHGSKVNARRFARMYADLGAPFAPASDAHKALFDQDMIEDVFDCEEFAFDAAILRELIRDRLDAAGVELRFNARALDVLPAADGIAVQLASGDRLEASFAFNACYGTLNHLRVAGACLSLPVKNELTEVAIIDPPAALAGLGVTVMDGPFFSVMPFPSLSAYSLTHVRFTPHYAWSDGEGAMFVPPPEHPQSRWLQMARDAQRYLPCAAEFRWRRSLFETKAVLQRNEIDDGRPIFLHRSAAERRLFSVLGGKFDNIYDLAEALTQVEPQWRGLDMRWFQPG